MKTTVVCAVSEIGAHVLSHCKSAAELALCISSLAHTHNLYVYTINKYQQYRSQQIVMSVITMIHTHAPMIFEDIDVLAALMIQSRPSSSTLIQRCS